MSEQPDSDKQQQPQEDPYSLADAGLGFFMILLVMFGSLIVFISLRGEPHGTQIATLITYTGAIFVSTFFRVRSGFALYSLDEPYVQEQLPRLLGIHLAYLLAVYFVDGWALSIQPSLSSWWVQPAGQKHTTPFDEALMIGIGSLALSQIILSRSILGRAKKRDQSNE